MSKALKVLGKKRGGPAAAAARQCGIDLSLVESNLLLSPAERMRRYNKTLQLALTLSKAVKERGAGP